MHLQFSIKKFHTVIKTIKYLTLHFTRIAQMNTNSLWLEDQFTATARNVVLWMAAISSIVSRNILQVFHANPICICGTD